MTRTFRIGIVGWGYATATFHAPLVRAVPGLELAAVSSSDPGKVPSGIPVEPSPQALFARGDLDLVVIPTPNETHHPLVAEALAVGLHVVVDKPFTLDLRQARDLEVRAARAGRLLAVFHNRRWDSDFLTLRRVLDSGELGRIVHFESHFDRYRPLVRDRWRERPEPGAGLWYDLGPHLLDQTLVLFGSPRSIRLDLAVQREGAQVDDWFHAVLDYGGLRAILHAGALVARPGLRFTVHGALGSFLKAGLDPQEDRLKAGLLPDSPGFGEDPAAGELVRGLDGLTRPVTSLPGRYLAFYEGIRDALRGAAANPVPAAEGVRVMSLLEAGLESAREGRAVPL